MSNRISQQKPRLPFGDRIALIIQLSDADLLVKQLGEALFDPCLSTRVWACQSLGRLGRPAVPALPVLRRISVETDERLLTAATNAINAIEATDREPQTSNGFLDRLLRALGAVHT